MTIITVEGVFASDIDTDDTFTVDYPDGYTKGDFKGGYDFKLAALNSLFSVPSGMTLSFGATSVTVTYKGATTLPSGTRYFFQFDVVGNENAVSKDGVELYTPVSVGIIDLGSPGTADADGYLTSGAITADTPVTVFTGALGSTADAKYGRNVVAAWTTTAVMTVTGTDVYGNVLVESSASGTSFTGKKAFKTITKVAVSADVTAATVGTGTVLGLPIFLSSTDDVIAEQQDNAKATAGTLAAGLDIETASTATTGDVRGTYSPNSAPDGSKAYALTAIFKDGEFLGNPQYAG